MTRHYSARAAAKRNQNFRRHIAAKNNPVRFVIPLPSDVNLNDVDWNPDHLEQIADKLARMKARWEKEDDERRRKRAAEILAEINRDK